MTHQSSKADEPIGTPEQILTELWDRAITMQIGSDYDVSRKKIDKARTALDRYYKDLVAFQLNEARKDAIISYKKVNRFLENEIRADELRQVARDARWSKLNGRTMSVGDRIAELEKEMNK